MKNKILTVSIIFILLSFAFINFSLGFTINSITCDYNGTTYTLDLPDEVYNYSYYFIARQIGTDQVFIYCSNEPFIYNEKCSAYYDSNKVDCLTCYKSTVCYYKYKLTTSTEWEFLSKTGLHVSGILTPSQNYWYEFIYTNVDICDSSGTVFFQQTPLTLEEVLMKAEAVKTFQTMMKNVVISLLVFLISFVALYKGWNFLRTQLKGS